MHQPVCVSGVSKKLDRQLPQQHAQQKGKKQKKIKILVVKVMVIHDRNDVITSMTRPRAYYSIRSTYVFSVPQRNVQSRPDLRIMVLSMSMEANIFLLYVVFKNLCATQLLYDTYTILEWIQPHTVFLHYVVLFIHHMLIYYFSSLWYFSNFRMFMCCSLTSCVEARQRFFLYFGRIDGTGYWTDGKFLTIHKS